MTADEILKKHEDDNEMHFHEVDRRWIIQAMEEYAAYYLQSEKIKLIMGQICHCTHPKDQD
jgi:hypothetical protein